MLLNLEGVYLSETQSVDIKFGREVQIGKPGLFKVQLFDDKKQFLGIGQRQEKGIIAPKRLFV